MLVTINIRHRAGSAILGYDAFNKNNNYLIDLYSKMPYSLIFEPLAVIG